MIKVGRDVIVSLTLILFALTGCSLNRLAIRSTGAVLNYGVESLNEEQDILIAEQAIAANLKLLEGLIKGDPGNTQLLLLAAQGFTGYALGFVEDKDPQRAGVFYKRGMDYGMKILKRNEAFEKAAAGMDMERFSEALKRFKKGDVPALFWTGNAWGSWVNLNRDSPKAIADVGKVELIMKRALELDEGYYYGGPHLFFVPYYGGRSRMFGGDPDKASEHFNKHIKLSGGKFLMAYVFYAKYYAVQMQDVDLFKDSLNKVLEAPADILPEQRLVNELAKVKASRLLKEVDNYF